MSNRSEMDAGTAFILILAVLAVLGLWALSRTLGADFVSTVKMAFGMVIGIAAVGAGVIFLQMRLRVALALLGAIGWASFMPIIHSWARGGQSEAEWMPLRFMEAPWWDSGLFLYGVEGVLIAIVVGLIYFDMGD